MKLRRPVLIVCALLVGALVALGLVAPAQAVVRTRLEVGGTLTSGQSLSSPNGIYRLTMRSTGNVALTKGSTVLWQTKTWSHPNARLVVTSTGDAVVRSSSGATLWSTRTSPASAVSLRLEDSGQVTVRSRGSLLLWSNQGGRTSYTQDTLRTGQTLWRGQGLWSLNGRYRAVAQGDGNFVVYDGSAALWNSGTAGTDANRLVLQGDSNLVLYGSAARWAMGWGTGADRLVMQDDGNLVMYDGSRAVWSSYTGYLGNSLQPSRSTLTGGHQLVSANHQFRAVMQGDGNFVVYEGSTARWNSGTAGTDANRIVLQGDGNVVIYGAAARWDSKTSGQGTNLLVMQDDGNLVAYAGSKAVWASRGLSAPSGDDYPDKDAVCAATGTVSGWCANSDWRKNGSPYSGRGYAWRNCTDFAAFRANKRAGHTVVPWGWGNANSWDEHARSAGLGVDGVPRVGDIAQSDGGSFGHVAVVAEVGSGQVKLEEYNGMDSTWTKYDGLYHTRWVSTGSYEYIHVG